MFHQAVYPRYIVCRPRDMSHNEIWNNKSKFKPTQKVYDVSSTSLSVFTILYWKLLTSTGILLNAKLLKIVLQKMWKRRDWHTCVTSVLWRFWKTYMWPTLNLSVKSRVTCSRGKKYKWFDDWNMNNCALFWKYLELGIVCINLEQTCNLL